MTMTLHADGSITKDGEQIKPEHWACPSSEFEPLKTGAGGRYLPPQVPINCEIDGETMGRAYGVRIERDSTGELCLMILTDPLIAAHLLSETGHGWQVWPTTAEVSQW